ncbi:MAG: SRPBCC family protein [Candidatus Hodarchaeales archaeon]
MSLEDSIEIKTKAERIFEFFLNLPENYKKWHPDHISSKWIKRREKFVGSEIYCEEYLHGALHKIKLRISNIEQNKRIDYQILFPTSLITPRGSFLIQENEETCIFIAQISFRFSWFLRKFAQRRMLLMKDHMKEESEYLNKY